MKRCIDSAGLLDLLVERGHTFRGGTQVKPSYDVAATPSSIVTIACTIDGTLPPEYRQRYYILAEHVPYVAAIFLHDDFEFPEPFRSVVRRQPRSTEFMYGPVRWLFRRLRSLRYAMIWPRGSFASYPLL